MKPVGWYLLVVLGAVVLFVVLEGARQQRVMSRTKDQGTGSRSIRAGLLGLAEVLEPERKVEMLKEERQEHVLPALPGDPPEPGGVKGKEESGQG